MKAGFSAAVRRASGFTLIEILAALAVVGILASVLIKGMQSARESAQMAKSVSNLRQLVIANRSYAAEHGHFVPADDRWNNKRWHGARESTSKPFDPSEGFLADYLGKSREVGICPRFQEMAQSEQTFELSSGGYGYNAAYIGGRPGGGYDAKGVRIPALLAQVEETNTVMFTTTAYATGDSIQEYPYCEPPFWDFGEGPTGWRPSPSVHFRFNGEALVAWADGRVSAERYDSRAVGENPHGGDAEAEKLGWFGPDKENGFWNPRRSFAR